MSVADSDDSSSGSRYRSTGRRRAFLTAVGASLLGFSTIGSAAPRPQVRSEDADFVVAADGSGDYEEFEDAHRVAESGDVIFLKEGTYSGPVSKSITIRGESDRDTVLELVGSSSADEPDLRGSPDFSDISLDLDGGETIRIVASETDDVSFERVEVRSGVETAGEVSLVVADSQFRDAVRAAGLTVTDSTFAGVVELTGGDVDLHELERSVFEEGVVFDSPSVRSQPGASITDCEFHAVADCGDVTWLTVESSTFNGLDLGILREPTVRDCTIHADDALGAAIVWDNRYGPLELEHSTITTDGSETDTALFVDGSGTLTLRGNTIEGTLRRSFSSETSGEIVGNRFESDGSVEWFIDGAPASVIAKNAFIGADIRIADSLVSVYDEDEQLGNYYSAFDGEDEDGDGVLDLPRPVPGDGEVTDQYPLASADVEQYIEQPEADDDSESTDEAGEESDDAPEGADESDDTDADGSDDSSTPPSETDEGQRDDGTDDVAGVGIGGTAVTIASIGYYFKRKTGIHSEDQE